jgi:hypothetical protein
MLIAIRNWVKANIYALLIALGIALLYLSSRPFLHDIHPRAGLFFTELAFASIIVSTFGLTIDKYQREEFVRLVNDERGELKRDIFLYAYGHTVPEQIREEIKEQILNCPFQRSDRRIELEFSQIEERGDRVLVQKRITFVVKNVTALTQTFKFEYSQITASEKDARAPHEFQCLKIRKGEAETNYGPGDLHDHHPGADTHVRKVSKDFSIGPSETVEIYYAMKEMRRVYEDDVMGSKHPVVGTTVMTARVNPPLVLEISAACKGKVPKTRPEHNPPRLYAWLLDEGLLPFQGISISWSPRTEVEGPAAEAAALATATPAHPVQNLYGSQDEERQL